MNIKPEKPRSPRRLSMGTLQEKYPRHVQYFRPGSKEGKKPQLVWERLWTTANGEYGNKYFHVKTKSSARVEEKVREVEVKEGESEMASQAHVQEDGVTAGSKPAESKGGENFEGEGNGLKEVGKIKEEKKNVELEVQTPTPKTERQSERASASSVVKLPPIPSKASTQMNSRERNTVLTPGKAHSEPIHGYLNGETTRQSRANIHESNRSRTSTRSRRLDPEFAMSGISRVYLQHRMGRYWETSTTTHIKS